MTPTILQRVRFSASPEALFEMYMDSSKHAASTGVPAKLSRKVGGAWQAYDGAIAGKNLETLEETSSGGKEKEEVTLS